MGAATQTNNADWSGYMNNPFILQTDGSSLTGIQLPFDFSMVYITPINMPIMLDFDASAPADFSAIPLTAGTPFTIQKTQIYNDGTMDVLRAIWTVTGTVQSSDLLIGNVDALVTALNVAYKDYAGHWTWSFTNGIEIGGMRSAIVQDLGPSTISPPRLAAGKAPVRLNRSTGSPAK